VVTGNRENMTSKRRRSYRQACAELLDAIVGFVEGVKVVAADMAGRVVIR
jgi:hypothetical protein